MARLFDGKSKSSAVIAKYCSFSKINFGIDQPWLSGRISGVHPSPGRISILWPVIMTNMVIVASGHQYHKPPSPGLSDRLHLVLQAANQQWGRLWDDRVQDVCERERNRVQDVAARRCLFNGGSCEIAWQIQFISRINTVCSAGQIQWVPCISQ